MQYFGTGCPCQLRCCKRISIGGFPMKLKEGFILHSSGDDHLMVATGEAAESFSGLVRSNETAQFILNLLQNEISEEQILDAMEKEYDAPRNVLAVDLDEIVAQLESAGFLA